jgi:hypothetical protein
LACLQVSTIFGSLNYFPLFNKFRKVLKNACTVPGLKPAHGPWLTGEAGLHAVARQPAARPSPQARLACKRDAGARRAHPPRGHRAPALHGSTVTIGEPVPKVLQDRCLEQQCCTRSAPDVRMTDGTHRTGLATSRRRKSFGSTVLRQRWPPVVPDDR